MTSSKVLIYNRATPLIERAKGMLAKHVYVLIIILRFLTQPVVHICTFRWNCLNQWISIVFLRPC